MKKIFYLYKPGFLKRKDASLSLESKKQIDYIPIEQVDIIICFSEVSFNKRTLSLLNKYHIPILFYNYYGNYIGRYTPKEYKDGKVLVNQVMTYQDSNRRLYIAKAIIYGSIKNMLSILKYYEKKGKDLSTIISKLQEYQSQLKEVDSIEKLLIIEAKSKQAYYGLFDIVLENEPFKFIKRTKRPPQNEINAMLSYGYSILYGLLLGIIDRSSLSPQISFIHSLSKNCDSLQFDIADIFKPIIIDRLIIRMIRKKQIKTEYFDHKDDGRVYLNQDGVSIFVSELDALLLSTTDYKGKKYTYKSILVKEVNKLSEYVKGNTNKINTFTMKW